jgi:hypothetical protein
MTGNRAANTEQSIPRFVLIPPDNKEIIMRMSASPFSANGKNAANREFRNLIRRERLLWLIGVIFPMALLIAIFVL